MNVIQFKKKNSNSDLDAPLKHKTDARQIILSLGLIGFLVGVVTFNHESQLEQKPMYLTMNDPIADLNRAIANARPTELINDVRVEKTLASELSLQDSRIPAQVAGAVPLVDQLRYGVLQGKYSILLNPKGEHQLTYSANSDIQDRPVFLVDREQFLKTYQGLWKLEFTKIQKKLPQVASAPEQFELLSADDKLLGLAEFTNDEEGRLLKMTLQPKKSLPRVSEK